MFWLSGCGTHRPIIPTPELPPPSPPTPKELRALEEEKRAAQACADTKLGVVVITKTRSGYLCRSGQADYQFRVALGENGLDKREEDDKKTPLGKRKLFDPFSHKDFGTFISIGYPTPAEVKLGYTGSEIGLHGPLRKYRDEGSVNVASDWTKGCIAVESDSVIKRIARWVTKFRVRSIDIR